MFSTCILKVTAWCNLNCTYCYMFNQADQTYSRVPRHLDESTALRVLERIAQHYVDFALDHFTIVLHGGEPTLWPDLCLAAFLKGVADLRRQGLNLEVELQTNGYRIRPATLALLEENGVNVGISLDGPRDVNDRHRVNHADRGSYDRVMDTVHGLIESGRGHLVGGFLCVADPDSAPSTFLDWANSLPVRRLDVLWPIEFSYDRPPWSPGELEPYRRKPRYGEWFAELFRLWWARDDPSLHVRLFEQCVLWHLGARRHTDVLVNDRINMFVVNTDGGYEYPDYFRAHKDGGCRTPFTVFDHSIEDLSRDAGFAYCLSLGTFLPTECAGCDVLGLCGGGFLPGRMDSETPLPQRKSVLCYDQYRFFTQVASTLGPHLRARARDEPVHGRGTIKNSVP
jgi:uncharacterized protein